MSLGLVLVAAGYGSCRKDGYGNPVSKLMEEIGGKPMFLHLLHAAHAAGIDKKIIVTNPLFGGSLQKETGEAGLKVGFVTQPERRGSGDALLRALPIAHSHGIDHVCVIYGDMPLVSPNTIKKLLCEHERGRHIVTMVVGDRTVHANLQKYGRVIYDDNGKIKRVVEVDNPSITQEEINKKSINPSIWVWSVSWLEGNIKKVIPTERGDGRPAEIYMPPLINIAYLQGKSIGSISGVDPIEMLGVNNLEQLEGLRTIIAREPWRLTL